MSDSADHNIHQACRQNDLDAVRRLLPESGPNKPDRSRGGDGATPLHACVWVASEEITSFLIEHGADVNGVDDGGITPLGLAIYFDRPAMARLLVKKGACVNSTEVFKSAFLQACNQGKFECLKAMCEEGSPAFGERNENGRNGLEEARWLGHEDVASYLQQNHYDRDVFTHIYEGDTSQVSRKVAGDSSLLGVRSAGLTPLGWAVRCERLQCVKTLLRAGADPNAGSVDEGNGSLGSVGADITPVHQAIEHVPILKLLLESGGSAVAADARGDTPLHQAAGHWMPLDDAVRLLATHANDDVNKRNGAGETALMLAVNAGKPSHIKILLECGADMTIANNAGFLPLDEARTCRARDLFRDSMREPDDTTAEIVLLLEADSERDIFYACFHDDRELLAQCIADKNRTDRGGVTPANWCAYMGSAKCLALLIDEGADVSTPTRRTTGPTGFAGGCAPVHNAAMHGHTECLRALLGTGKADLSLKNECDRTALEEAYDSFAKDIGDCIALLSDAAKNSSAED